ncbi:MAG TPA: hypothetical protein VGI06_09620 [Acidimicrobiales bacterium]
MRERTSAAVRPSPKGRPPAPPGKRMGHAGAIISGSSGTARAKMDALEAAGATVAQNPTEAGELMVEVVSKLR